MREQIDNHNQNAKTKQDLVIRDNKNLNKIKILGIISLVLALAGLVVVIALFASITALDLTKIEYDSEHIPGYEPPLLIDYGSLFLFLFGVAPLILATLLSFISSILILAINWNNTNLNDGKILWGILGMFLLGPIAILIFSSTKIENQK